MNTIRLRACLIFIVLGFGTAASAQATRTWVSGVGDDANPCSRTAPCKTFAGAISKTAEFGEINALDDGGFGAVTITKAITIDGGGHVAGVLAAGSNGIIINAGATDVITLRGLDINGILGSPSGAGIQGVNILAAKQVNIDNCKIYGFSQRGVNVLTTGGAAVAVQIVNSMINNNSGAGVLIGSGGSVTIASSALTGNGSAGVYAGGASAKALVSNSNISMNAIGLHSDSSAVIRITHDDVFFNTGFSYEAVAPGLIETYVDNRILDGPAGHSGALTPVSVP